MPKPTPKPMHVIIRERCDLAVTYAEDGAYLSAARVLRQCAADAEALGQRNAADMLDSPPLAT